MDQSKRSPNEKVPTTNLQMAQSDSGNTNLVSLQVKSLRCLLQFRETLWLTLPHFLFDRLCCAVTWHCVDAKLGLFSQ